MTERWRCFVAASLDDELRRLLAAAVEPWRTDAALRWSAPESWHLTLAFLGSVEEGAIGGARSVVAEVARRHRPMRVDARGIGAFPSAGRARVVWYGIDDPDRRLTELARDLAASLGLDAASPFRAHVTLARVRRGSADLRSWLRGASSAAPDGRMEIDRVHLMRSHLGAEAARYETLATMELGGGNRG